MVEVAVSPRRLLRRLASLGPGEPWLLVRMACVAAVLPLFIRALSLPRLVRLFDPGRGPAVDPPPDPQPIVDLADGLLRREIGPFHTNCVNRSLLLFYFLGKAGYPTVIYFGISRRDDGLAGHCWLEHRGEPVAEGDDPKKAFEITYRYPDRSRQPASALALEET